MKWCSKCGRSYSDESLNFCLEDGTVLSRSNDPQATLLNTSPRPTNPQTTEVLPRLPIQPKSAQPWSIYLIIGLVVLVVGTVGIALIVVIATNSPSSTSNHNSSTASPSYSQPSPSPVINLSGSWRDVLGGGSYITQTGETFKMTATGRACRGEYVTSATGTISGTRIDLIYESTYSRGQCSGSVSADGVRVTLTCTDSECGQFQSMSERVKD